MGAAGEGWGFGSLSFDVQGVGAGGLTQFEPIQTDRKRGDGCKNWTFFMDVINVWSLTNFFCLSVEM